MKVEYQNVWLSQEKIIAIITNNSSCMSRMSPLFSLRNHDLGILSFIASAQP